MSRLSKSKGIALGLALSLGLTGCVGFLPSTESLEDAVRVDSPPVDEDIQVNIDTCEKFNTDLAVLQRTIPKSGGSRELHEVAWTTFAPSVSSRASEAVDGTLVAFSLKNLAVEASAFANLMRSGDNVGDAQVDSVNEAIEFASVTCVEFLRAND